MIKTDFIKALASGLASLPQSEIDKTAAYYSEIIEDRMEDGMAEEEAVEALGGVDSIVETVMYDMSLSTLMKARVAESKSKASNKGLWIALVVLGFPLWFPLLLAFIVILLAIYITIWSLILSLYAVVVSLGISGIAGIVGGVALCFAASLPTGIGLIGAGLCGCGLTLFMIMPVVAMTKGLVRLTASIAHKIKSFFITRKGGAL
jgi:uncharacterized membrane protein